MFFRWIDRETRSLFCKVFLLELEACINLKADPLEWNKQFLGETHKADLTSSGSSPALSNGFDSINSLIMKLRRAFGTG